MLTFFSHKPNEFNSSPTFAIRPKSDLILGMIEM